jgi:cytosine/adenosine deaminase-related metal-dependent hydrolase
MVMTSALQKDVDALRDDGAKLDGSRVLIYHVAEGKPGTIVHDEFVDLDSALCLKPGLIGVHGTALTAADFKRWQDAVNGVDPAEKATLVWSPFSNLWLYHQTTDVVEADAKGLRIALGADWAPSGTKHVLGELKVADAYNTDTLGGHFSDERLCDMVTTNPGDALATAWGAQIGRLQAGNAADVVVLDRHHPDPYRNLTLRRTCHRRWSSGEN